MDRLTNCPAGSRPETVVPDRLAHPPRGLLQRGMHGSGGPSVGCELLRLRNVVDKQFDGRQPPLCKARMTLSAVGAHRADVENACCTSPKAGADLRFCLDDMVGGVLEMRAVPAAFKTGADQDGNMRPVNSPVSNDPVAAVRRLLIVQTPAARTIRSSFSLFGPRVLMLIRTVLSQ